MRIRSNVNGPRFAPVVVVVVVVVIVIVVVGVVVVVVVFVATEFRGMMTMSPVG